MDGHSVANTQHLLHADTRCLVHHLRWFVGTEWIDVALIEGAQMKILLIVSDTCLEPSITNNATEIRVTIGISHDFDNILDVTSGILSNEQIAHIHKLWSDDEFPRNFERIGDDLIISARD